MSFAVTDTFPEVDKAPMAIFRGAAIVIAPLVETAVAPEVIVISLVPAASPALGVPLL